MLNQAVVGNIFNFRIGDATVVFEKGRHPPTSDIAVLVDCGRQYCAAVLPEPHRIIGTTSKKRNTKWSACNDHDSTLPQSKITISAASPDELTSYILVPAQSVVPMPYNQA